MSKSKLDLYSDYSISRFLAVPIILGARVFSTTVRGSVGDETFSTGNGVLKST